MRLAVRCRFRRGAFSGEAIYRLTLPCGTEVKGMTPYTQCRTLEGSVLDESRIPAGGQIEGMLHLEHNYPREIRTTPLSSEALVTLPGWDDPILVDVNDLFSRQMVTKEVWASL